MAELLTSKELADKLKISRMTLNRWRTLGMPFLSIGRQVRFELEPSMEWIKENREKILRGE